jgi:hypothetical protein
MACTKHFLNLEWEHHRWRKHVTLAEKLPTQERNMWGRAVNREFVHCVKHDVCDVCGKTREDVNCLCDCEVGDRCPIRLQWMNAARQLTA